MSATPSEFSDFMRWYNSLRDRFGPDETAPTHDERFFWGPHDEVAAEALELLTVSTALVGYQGPDQEQLAEQCGPLHLQALRKHVEAIDPAHLQTLARQMTQSTVRQRESNTVDVEELTAQLATLRAYTEDLRGAAIDIGNRVDEQSHEDFMRALEQAARNTPGLSVRITETVVSPDGQHHDLRDDMAIGPDPDSDSHISFGVASDIKTATGIDDSRTRASIEAVHRRRFASLAERLALRDHRRDDELAIQKHLLNATTRELEFAGALPDLPASLAGLLPGHIHALRMNVLSNMTDAVQDGLDRGRRGDNTALVVAWQSATLAEAVRTATPYFLPINRLTPPSDPPGTPGPALAPGDHFVFHDSPVPGPAGLHITAWLFSANEHGAPDESALLYNCHADGSFETHYLSLHTGACTTLAQSVLNTLTHGQWSTTKRRKLPGRPGEHAWRSALGRVSTKEMRTGSLAQVRTLNPDQ